MCTFCCRQTAPKTVGKVTIQAELSPGSAFLASLHSTDSELVLNAWKSACLHQEGVHSIELLQASSIQHSQQGP